MASGFSSSHPGCLAIALLLASALFLNNAHLSVATATAAPPLADEMSEEDPHSIIPHWSYLAAMILPVVIVTLMLCIAIVLDLLIPKSVLMVQVLVPAKPGNGTGSAIHGISGSIDSKSWPELLRGNIKALLERQDSFIYGSTTTVEVKRWLSYRGVRARVGELMSKELEKLGIQREVSLKSPRLLPISAPQMGKDYMLVTIMVGLYFTHRLRTTDTREDMKETLSYLDTKISNTVAAEVVLAYRDRFSTWELLKIYPNMKYFIA